MQYGGSLRNKLQQDLSNDRKKSEASKKKKSATSVTKVFYICSMVVHCEANCNGGQW